MSPTQNTSSYLRLQQIIGNRNSSPPTGADITDLGTILVGRCGGRPISKTGKVGSKYHRLAVGRYSRPARSPRGGGRPMSGLSEHRSQLTQFQALFTGYSQAYGTFEIKETDPQTGKIKGNARTIRRGAPIQAWEEHLAGGPKGLGAIPLLDDSVSVKWAAIDIDDNQIDHCCLEAKVNELGLPLIVCRSNTKEP